MDGAEIIARVGNQILFQSPVRPDEEEPGLRILPVHQLGQGDGRIHMARRAAAGKEDAL